MFYLLLCLSVKSGTLTRCACKCCKVIHNALGIKSKCDHFYVSVVITGFSFIQQNKPQPMAIQKAKRVIQNILTSPKRQRPKVPMRQAPVISKQKGSLTNNRV